VERCKSIVSGILMSAGEARGTAPQVTTVRRFIEQLVGEWQGVLMPGSLRFHDHMGEDVAIVADAALRQVIGNVIDNAAEASPGRVDITAARRDDDLVLEIADTGPGFSQEILENFGKPYHSTKGKPGGGLGLFLLVNVARKLGGDVRAGNRPGGGARVELTLPLDALAYRKAPAA
jgi:two-component system sensor histidine kinase RegB